MLKERVDHCARRIECFESVRRCREKVEGEGAGRENMTEDAVAKVEAGAVAAPQRASPRIHFNAEFDRIPSNHETSPPSTSLSIEIW